MRIYFGEDDVAETELDVDNSMNVLDIQPLNYEEIMDNLRTVREEFKKYIQDNYLPILERFDYGEWVELIVENNFIK